MAEGEGFELSCLFRPSVFETAPLNQTPATFQYWCTPLTRVAARARLNRHSPGTSRVALWVHPYLERDRRIELL